MNSYEKLFTALKYYLLGKNFHKAIKALEYARKFHSGVRKDGFTPEFQHQLEICHFLLTLKNLRNEELVLATALLHDVIEDYNVSPETIEKEFDSDIARAVECLSKKVLGQKKDSNIYFQIISECPVASIVKGGDRIHNIQSMVGVFSEEKQKKYIQEVEECFLPMLKKASYNFPDQSLAYFNIKHMLRSQIRLIKPNLEEKKD